MLRLVSIFFLYLLAQSAHAYEWQWSASYGANKSGCESSAANGNASGPPFYQCKPDSSGTGWNLQMCSDPSATSVDTACGNTPLQCGGKTKLYAYVEDGACEFNTVVECMRAGFSFNVCVGDVAGGIAGLDGFEDELLVPDIAPPNCLTKEGIGITEICFGENPEGKSCGLVNGNSICVDNNETSCKTVSLMTGGKKTVCSAGVTPPIVTGQTATAETTTVNTSNTVGDVTTTTTYNITGTGTSGPNSGGTGEGATPAEQAEDERAKGSVSGGDSCQSAPVCKGDVIDCEVVKQAWRNSCTVENSGDSLNAHLSSVSGENATDVNGMFTFFGGGDPTDLSDELTNFTNQTGSAGTCPAAKSISLGFGNYSFDYQPICDVAILLRPFLILIFSLIGGRVVMTAFNS